MSSTVGDEWRTSTPGSHELDEAHGAPSTEAVAEARTWLESATPLRRALLRDQAAG